VWIVKNEVGLRAIAVCPLGFVFENIVRNGRLDIWGLGNASEGIAVAARDQISTALEW
jgi:hypothetical protein